MAAGADEGEERRMRKSKRDTFDVVIVGAGPAGLGCAYALTHAAVDNVVVLERDKAGASFDRWPAEMRFITPSFNSNQFGCLDLNSFGLRISPAFTIGQEHPTGRKYAEMLRGFANFLQLPVRAGVDVRRVEALGNGGFQLHTTAGEFRAKFVIWAAGEFQYPKRGGFPGAEHAIHNSMIRSYRQWEGDDFIIVGGYESGIDAAIGLAACGKRVRVFDWEAPWERTDSDPSTSLSTFTIERLKLALETGRIELIGHSPVVEIRPRRGKRAGFEVLTADGGAYSTPVAPILATGFETSLVLVRDLFDWESGRVKLTEQDESTKTPGFFLVGPQVWHDQVIFCFIYKFRQRFAVVVDSIARRLGRDTTEFVTTYRSRGMFLDDLSCCKEACESC